MGTGRRSCATRGYGTALVLPRTWKAAIAPTLAGIPERVGFFGEARFGLINRMRWGEKALPRFIDKNAALALPADAPLPPEWPVPQLVVPPEQIARWRQANDLGSGPAVALAPGSVGASKRWTYYPGAARLLVERGLDVWVVGGPGEKALAQEIVAAGRGRVRDLTGTDLRNGILAMAAAGVAISNNSGLMHIAAAIGTPTMGIFGPTSPYLWAPLNGLAATVLQTKSVLSCQPCQRTVCTMNDHRCMRDIDPAYVARRGAPPAGHCGAERAIDRGDRVRFRLEAELLQHARRARSPIAVADAGSRISGSSAATIASTSPGGVISAGHTVLDHEFGRARPRRHQRRT